MEERWAVAPVTHMTPLLLAPCSLGSCKLQAWKCWVSGCLGVQQAGSLEASSSLYPSLFTAPVTTYHFTLHTSPSALFSLLCVHSAQCTTHNAVCSGSREQGAGRAAGRGQGAVGQWAVGQWAVGSAAVWTVWLVACGCVAALTHSKVTDLHWLDAKKCTPRAQFTIST